MNEPFRFCSCEVSVRRSWLSFTGACVLLSCLQLFSLVFSRMIDTIFKQGDDAEEKSFIFMGLFFAIGVCVFV